VHHMRAVYKATAAQKLLCEIAASLVNKQHLALGSSDLIFSAVHSPAADMANWGRLVTEIAVLTGANGIA